MLLRSFLVISLFYGASALADSPLFPEGQDRPNVEVPSEPETRGPASDEETEVIVNLAALGNENIQNLANQRDPAQVNNPDLQAFTRDSGVAPADYDVDKVADSWLTGEGGGSSSGKSSNR